MSTARKTQLTAQEYLAIERKAEQKSEFFHGEMFAMVGASRKHNLITVNVASQLHDQLQDGNCEVYVGDMRVKIEPTGLYTYPDVVVTCEEPQFEDAELDTLSNPTLLIEVLSPSTEAYDRGQKFSHYRKLDSLREYLMIEQDRHHIEHFVRQPNNQWLLSETTDPQGSISLPGIACTLSMAEVYDKVGIDTADGETTASE